MCGTEAGIADCYPTRRTDNQGCHLSDQFSGFPAALTSGRRGIAAATDSVRRISGTQSV